MQLNLLLLAGGKSTRMGSPKHLLPLPDGRPLYHHLIEILIASSPRTKNVFISLSKESRLDETLRTTDNITMSSIGPHNAVIQIIYDDNKDDVGPAAGLIAAFHTNPSATWLIIACDYPLLRPELLHQLKENYEAPVTCFRNKEGYCEPFIGIWGPVALSRLETNVNKGICGPSHTVKELNGKLVLPKSERWIINVNTKEEWDAVKEQVAMLNNFE